MSYFKLPYFISFYFRTVVFSDSDCECDIFYIVIFTIRNFHFESHTQKVARVF